MSITIRKKLGIVVFSLLLLMVLVAAGSYLQLRLIEGKLAKIVDEEEPQSAAAYELEINLIGTGFAVLGYLHDHDPQHLDRIREDEAEFRSYLLIPAEYSVVFGHSKCLARAGAARCAPTLYFANINRRLRPAGGDGSRILVPFHSRAGIRSIRISGLGDGRT